MNTKLLFLSEHGTTRCQMAAAVAAKYAPANVDIITAAIRAEELSDAAQDMIGQINADFRPGTTKNLREIDTSEVDIVITLDDAAARHCPILPSAPAVIRWHLPENTAKNASADPADYYRTLLPLIEKKIAELFAGGYIHTIQNIKRNHEAVLDHFSEGIIVHDPDRIIIWFNQAAERLTGYSRQEVIGRDCHEIFPGGFCSGKCSFCEGAPPAFDSMEYPINLTTRDGRQKRAEMTVVAMRDEHLNFQGVLACIRDVTEVAHLRHKLKTMQSFHGIIGKDDQMLTIYENIKDIAASDFPVLILGESGTGKELVAGAIHGESARSGRPFVTVNCGALPEGILESELFGHVRGAFTGAIRDKKGRFELADTGTIFLDEIGELSPNMQVKLLRVLQENTIERVGGDKPIKINVRVLSATNRDLRAMVQKRQFREDLFYRLCVVPLDLPPLRQRRNDIPLLVSHFIERFSKDTGKSIQNIAAHALDIMLDYSWPGNVRELQNAIQYAFVKCKLQTIEPEHLPPEILKSRSPGRSNGQKRQGKLNYEQVVRTLEQCGGNKKKAAEMLGVGRSTIHRFIKTHNLSV